MTEDESRLKRIEEAITLGDDAQKLLNNRLLQSYFIRKKADLMAKFGQTRATESNIRDEIWRMTVVVNEFEDELKKFIEDADFARNELKEMDSEI